MKLIDFEEKKRKNKNPRVASYMEKERRRTSEVPDPNWRRPGWPVSEADLVLSSWIFRRSASLCFSKRRILTASWAVPTYPSPMPDILVSFSFFFPSLFLGLCLSQALFLFLSRNAEENINEKYRLILLSTKYYLLKYSSPCKFRADPWPNRFRFRIETVGSTV